jgi:hypothetical protein
MMAALGRGGTWDSALSVGEFAAIRSVGFEPAGQVFGAVARFAGPRKTALPPSLAVLPASRNSPTLSAGSRRPMTGA